jgi:protein-disulfide isomerase
MFRTLIVSLLILLPVTPRAQTTPISSPQFSATQRAEIVEILRQALRTDPSILRDAVTALQADEAARRDSDARAALAAVGSAMVSAEDQVAGNPAGDVTVVEFYDLRCPYCRRMLPVTAALIRQDSRVKWVYKDIPVLGPPSVLAARAALAAQRQGRYIAMHDALMAGTPDITLAVIRAAADHAGLDWARLQRDMDDPAIQARLDANLELARKLSIDGTPAYVVGGRLLAGAMDLASLQDVVTQVRQR